MERISRWSRCSSLPTLWWNWHLAHRFQSCSLTKDLREQYPQFQMWSSGKITIGWFHSVWIGMFRNCFIQLAKWTPYAPMTPLPIMTNQSGFGLTRLWRCGVCYCGGKFSLFMLNHSCLREDRIKWCFSRNTSNAEDWFRVIHADKLPGWRQNVGRAELLA